MFACLAAGRLVQTNLQQISENQYLFVLDQAININHLAIFLTGTTPFPENYGASIHFNFSNDPQNWKYLGFITNSKPSAIFKLGSSLKSQEVQVSIGISIEPLETIETQDKQKTHTEDLKSLVPAGFQNQENLQEITDKITETFVSFANYLLQSFFNYSASFGSGENISFQVLEKWFTTFNSKIRADPLFWKKN